jgi:alanyl-tRNA synthetase
MVEYCEMHAHNPATGEHTAHCFSRELCGGTHLHSTGGVGMLQIVSDTSIGAGMRRIEALTGPEAERYIEDRLELIGSLAQRFRAPAEEIPGRIDALEAQVAEEHRRAEARLLVARVDAANVDALRALADRLRERLQSGVVVLAALVEDRPQFLAMVTDDLVGHGIRADVLVRAAATVAGGGGGGRPQLAQAGGRDASKLDAALEAARAAADAGLTGS